MEKCTNENELKTGNMSKEKVFLIVFALLILGVENIFAGGTIISNVKRIASGKIDLELKTGKLTIIPLNQNSIRVQFSQPDSEPVEELIYTESVKAPKPQIKELEIGKRKGVFPGMKGKRTFNIVLVSPQSGVGISTSSSEVTVSYNGKATKLKIE